MLCNVLTSCKPDQVTPYVTFTFQLTCSEELLDFVIPTAVYIDENNKEREIELDRSMFTKMVNDSSGLIGDGEDKPHLYVWEQEIKLDGVSSAQRDMRVTYRIREDKPAIDKDKDYYMLHELEGNYFLQREDGSIVNYSITNHGTVIINGKDAHYIQGNLLGKYLADLVDSPDYCKQNAK